MKRVALLIIVASLGIVAGVVPVAQAGPRIGSDTYDQIRAAADDAKRCGVGSNRLVAAMIAVTYNESGRGSAGPPPSYDAYHIPMPAALSRSDTGFYGNPRLWPFQDARSSQPWHRIFWHPGIGLFQLDDAGKGSNMSWGKFLMYKQAEKVAKLMTTAYCKSNGSVDAMFTSAGPWYGCGNDHKVLCHRYFQAIYDGNNQPLNLAKVPGYDRDGGNEAHRCMFGTASQASAREFLCAYVNFHKFSPCKNYLTCTASHDGTNITSNSGSMGNTSPLAKPFYVIRGKRDGDPYEYRYWMKQDTNLSSNYFAYRPYGSNSRLALNSGYANQTLCDITKKRGVCPDWVLELGSPP